jgi:uncharacterized protein (TIGR00251 family)
MRKVENQNIQAQGDQRNISQARNSWLLRRNSTQKLDIFDTRCPLISMAITLPVKVVPCASRSKVAGWLGDELKLRVSAPPEKGKANLAVEHLLATVLNLASEQVNIIKGRTSTHKLVEIHGITHLTIENTFGKPNVA